MSGGDLPKWLIQIEEDLEFELLVRLRDGRTFVGFLTSFDHFGNLLLSGARQRLSVFDPLTSKVLWADMPWGCLLVRGENVSLCGRLRGVLPENMVERPVEQVMRLALETENSMKNFTWKEDPDDIAEWS